MSLSVTGAGFLPMFTDVVMVVTEASLSRAAPTLAARGHFAAAAPMLPVERSGLSTTARCL